MVYLHYISCLRYTILVGSPRNEGWMVELFQKNTPIPVTTHTQNSWEHNITSTHGLAFFFFFSNWHRFWHTKRVRLLLNQSCLFCQSFPFGQQPLRRMGHLHPMWAIVGKGVDMPFTLPQPFNSTATWPQEKCGKLLIERAESAGEWARQRNNFAPFYFQTDPVTTNLFQCVWLFMIREIFLLV